MGPSLTPIGLAMRLSSSTWAPSSWRVRSPIHTKWLETSYGCSVRESMRVRACSYSRMSASCEEKKSTVWNSSGSTPIASMNARARSISVADALVALADRAALCTKSVFHACI